MTDHAGGFLKTFHDVAMLREQRDRLKAVLGSVRDRLIRARHRTPDCPFCGYAIHLRSCDLLALLAEIEEVLS